LDVPGSAGRHLQIKQRQRGLDEASYVESFLVLNALGVECLEDFEKGSEGMLGHAVPSPGAARKFLYQFHAEENLQKAQQQLPAGRHPRLSAHVGAVGADGSGGGPLAGGQVLIDRPHHGGQPVSGRQCAGADATVSGDQTGLSNATGEGARFYFRGDSGCWQEELLHWLRTNSGRRGRVGRSPSASACG